MVTRQTLKSILTGYFIEPLDYHNKSRFHYGYEIVYLIASYDADIHQTNRFYQMETILNKSIPEIVITTPLKDVLVDDACDLIVEYCGSGIPVEDIKQFIREQLDDYLFSKIHRWCILYIVIAILTSPKRIKAKMDDIKTHLWLFNCVIEHDENDYDYAIINIFEEPIVWIPSRDRRNRLCITVPKNFASGKVLSMIGLDNAGYYTIKYEISKEFKNLQLLDTRITKEELDALTLNKEEFIYRGTKFLNCDMYTKFGTCTYILIVESPEETTS